MGRQNFARKDKKKCSRNYVFMQQQQRLRFHSFIVLISVLKLFCWLSSVDYMTTFSLFLPSYEKNIYINVYLKQVSDRLIFKQPLEDIISLQFNLVLILMPSFFANIQLNCHAWQTPNRYILNEAEKI